MNIKSSFFSLKGKTSGKIYFLRTISLAFVFVLVFVLMFYAFNIPENIIELFSLLGPILFYIQDVHRANPVRPEKDDNRFFVSLLAIIYLIGIFGVIDDEAFRIISTGVTLYLLIKNAEYSSSEEKQKANKF